MLVTLLLISVTIGFILENVGSIIESKLWDRLQDNQDHEDEWYKYLRTAFLHEPVGQRYLRTLTLRMKFELAFSLSLLTVCVGMFCIHLAGLVTGYEFFISSLLLITLAMYLSFESYQTSKVLSRVRHELLLGVILNPVVP